MTEATKDTDPFFGIPNSFWEHATKEHCKDKQDDPFYKSLLEELEGEKGEKVILKEKD